MFCRKKNKKMKKPKVIHLQRFQPLFITTDGVEHEGYKYNWFNADGLLCTVPEYIMIDIKSDGYIEDQNDVMYPLQNILSIDWKLIDEKVVLDNFRHEFEVVFTNREVEKMDEYKLP